jgi:hypothetical protein
MNTPPIDPSYAAAAKEPEAKPLFSDKSVTITNHAVIISGKQYNLSEIEEVSIQKDKWQTAVSFSCLAASAYFYVFQPSLVFLVFWNNNYPKPVYSIFLLLFVVFGVWASASAAKLVFKRPTGNPVVLQGNGRWIKKIKAEIDRARIYATDRPSQPQDISNPPA